ncbi:MAG: TMEM165/GDT1 family protein, partial [Pseudomonadota bacterium]
RGDHALRWSLAVRLPAPAGRLLSPAPLADDEAPSTAQRGLGILGTTIVAFFFAEMGDKTQIATVALAARFHDVFSVVAGTTVGMLLANVPAVLMGNKFAARMPITLVHRIAALIFLVLGVLALLGVGK